MSPRNPIDEPRPPRKLDRLEPSRGSVLVLALLAVVLIAIGLVAAVTTTVVHARSLQSQTHAIEAHSLAEGGNELASQTIRHALVTGEPVPTEGAATIAGHEIVWTANATRSPVRESTESGVTAEVNTFRLRSIAQVERTESAVTRFVEVATVPLFQYAIFFDGDLELIPSSPTTVSGRVHVNGDLALGSDTQLTLATDAVRATGEIVRHRPIDLSLPAGEILTRTTDGEGFTAIPPEWSSLTPGWTQRALTDWGGALRSGDHGVRKVLAPGRGALEVGGAYDRRAAVRIVGTEAFSEAGQSIPLLPGTLTEISIFDEREGQTVSVTEIDLFLLTTSGAFPTNGLIHASRPDASSGTPNGICLSNGANLAGPLTVATPGPLYLRGDFNTRQKQPAAVLADAVNLLSNAWDGSKNWWTTLPRATATTYQVSIVTGDVPHEAGTGGIAELARFHEDWSGVEVTISGSLARLFASEIATAPRNPLSFRPPEWNWSFDHDLLDRTQLPPFTPTTAVLGWSPGNDGRPALEGLTARSPAPAASPSADRSLPPTEGAVPQFLSEVIFETK